MTQLKRHRGGLWLTELSLPEFDVRGAVLTGSERSLVWDTLSHPRDMAAVVERIDRQPAVVVYSHADWDHVWGTAGLPMPEWIVAHDQCRMRFERDVPSTLREKLLSEADVWQGVVLMPPNLTFRTEMSLCLGDLTLTLRHLAGHTLDCIVGFVPEWGVLLAGDTVESPFPVVNEGSPIEEWIVQLQGWAREPGLETVIPAHGPVSGRRLIESNIQYLETLLEGRDFPLFPDLPAFYLQTHQTNLEIARQYRAK